MSNVQDFLTWGALVMAGGSIIAVVRFWIDIGRAYQRADDANKAASLMAANISLLTERFNAFQVECARTYVSAGALQDAMRGISDRLDGVTQRLDSIISLQK